MSLGKEIKKARIDKGWKQQDLQVATGITQKYLSEVELDKVDPRVSIVQRIAQALGVSIATLVREEPATEAPQNAPPTTKRQRTHKTTPVA